MYLHGKQWYYFIKAASDRPDPEPTRKTRRSNWYPDFQVDKSKGLLDDYSQQNLSSQVVCCMEHPRDGRKLYTAFDSYLELGIIMKNIVPEARHFHEVIFGRTYQKPHFDIDWEPCPSPEVQQIFLDQLITAILEVFKRWPELDFSLARNMIVCSSHGPAKLSYHIIINGFIHTDHQEAEDFCYLVRSKLSPEFQAWLDVGIYTKLHQLRVLSSTKRGTDRIKQFQERWLYQAEDIVFEYPMEPESEDHSYMMQLQSSLITYIGGCQTLPSIRDTFLSEDLGNLESAKLLAILPVRRLQATFDQISDDVSKAAIQLLAELAETTPDARNFPYRHLQTRGGLVLLKRVRASICRICERRHQNENPYLIVTPKHQVYFCCRRSADGRKLYVGNLGLTAVSSPVITEVESSVTEELPVLASMKLPVEKSEGPLAYMKTVQTKHKFEITEKLDVGNLTTSGSIDPNFMY